MTWPEAFFGISVALGIAAVWVAALCTKGKKLREIRKCAEAGIEVYYERGMNE